MDLNLGRLKAVKEVLIDFALREKANLNYSDYSVVTRCAQVREFYDGHFDDLYKIKATSEYSKAMPSDQTQLEGWYYDMLLLLSCISLDMQNPQESDIVS